MWIPANRRGSRPDKRKGSREKAGRGIRHFYHGLLRLLFRPDSPSGPSVRNAIRIAVRTDRPAVLWIACYTTCLLVWLPQNTFYRLFYLPAIVLFVAGILRIALPAKGRVAVACCVVLITGWNFVFFVYPNSKPAANEPLHFALAQRPKWPAGTAIAFTQFHPDIWTITYFNPQVSWIGMEYPTLQTVEACRRELDQVGRDLWLEAATYDLPAKSSRGRTWLEQVVNLPASVTVKTSKRSFRFYKLTRLHRSSEPSRELRAPSGS